MIAGSGRTLPYVCGVVTANYSWNLTEKNESGKEQLWGTWRAGGGHTQRRSWFLGKSWHPPHGKIICHHWSVPPHAQLHRTILTDPPGRWRRNLIFKKSFWPACHASNMCSVQRCCVKFKRYNPAWSPFSSPVYFSGKGPFNLWTSYSIGLDRSSLMASYLCTVNLKG